MEIAASNMSEAPGVVHDQTNLRVMMWCVPRSGSTAITKCMSFIDDIEVWLEPYYVCMAAGDAYCRAHPDEDFPLKIEGNEDVFREAAYALNGGKDWLDDYTFRMLSSVTLKNIFNNLDPAKKFVFVKDLSLGMPPSRFQYLPDRSSGFKYFFLIRHPLKTYTSLRKCLLRALKVEDSKNFHVISDSDLKREGDGYVYQAIHQLWAHIRARMGDEPIIVDVDELLEDPSVMLPRICNALGIPYTPKILSWDASTDVILRWKTLYDLNNPSQESTWFEKAFRSTCFIPSSTSVSLDDVTDDIKEVVKKEMIYYEEMYSKRITMG